MDTLLSNWKDCSAAEPGLGVTAWRSSIHVQGMFCAACSHVVEAALLAQPGVLQAQVNAASGEGSVVWEQGRVTPEQWLQAIANSGYRAAPSKGKDALQLARQAQKRMLWRWLVAGFCMMQVMMYAWPYYGAQVGDIDPDSDRLLRWASWLLSLPVMLFSSSPFFFSAWQAIKQKRVSMDLPVALGILITFCVSTVAAFEPSGPLGKELYFDSLTMFVFILLSGRWLDARLRTLAAGSLLSNTPTMPQRVLRLLPDGSAHWVAMETIGLGDQVRVLPGAGIPVDGVIQNGQSWVDESVLTGESQAIYKQEGHEVSAGSINQSQSLDIKVLRWGKHTRYAQTVDLMEKALQAKTPTLALADRIAQPFLIGVLALSGLAWAYWWPSDPHRAWLASIAVLIVTCPCALALAAPMALLTSVAALMREGVLVRDPSAIERLHDVDTVIFDKTGTLTESQLTIEKIQVIGQNTRESILAIAAAIARHSLHPYSLALARTAAQHAIEQARAVTESPGQGLRAIVGGKVYRLGSWSFCNPTSCASNPSTGARSRVWLADELGLLASFDFSQTYRQEAHRALRTLHKANTRLGIYSGDHRESVEEAARALELPSDSLVRSACSAQEKLKAMQQEKRNGHRLAMVGDGINDGPVLTEANASFSFADSAALAQTRADFLLVQPALTLIPATLLHARKTMRIVRQNFTWAILYNLMALPLAISGSLVPWAAGLGMAMSSILVIANAARLRHLDPPQDTLKREGR